MSPPPLRVCLYQSDRAFFPSADKGGWKAQLQSEPFDLKEFGEAKSLSCHLQGGSELVDCLVLVSEELGTIAAVGDLLVERGLFLPTIVIAAATSPTACNLTDRKAGAVYHKAVSMMLVSSAEQLAQVNWVEEIERAIALFLQQSPNGVRLDPHPTPAPNQIRQQQRRLAEKLQERLGYAGVYYKRDTDRFYRHLPAEEQQELMARLETLYRGIVLEYFQAPDRVNPLIDEFAALAFLADLSVSQVLELHMQLMDNFAKQLKLEGRSEEIVLDYRITLIDAIAHLSEMYRRSIPRSPQTARQQGDRP
ncbi:circadian clock protein KaiA [Synechococcus sp. PCC 7336]|uniref:circadian clock protein KaiA n=1 Tax=Synechococcus sp. PCC 7336 TaxID=195250 RepID=UPI00034C28AA|nr:circadian clock protein KaiA [Synechococcus sp. PCC 7336]